MKKAGSVVLSLFASLALAAVIGAAPRVSAANHAGTRLNTAQDTTQSVSGTIASVERSSFTLTVASETTPKGHAFLQDTAPKTMTFQIDKNTTVDGKLKVNAKAGVTYRQDASGNNIAVSVRVSS